MLRVLGRVSAWAFGAYNSWDVSSEYKLSPICSLLICIAILLLALWRFLWWISREPLELIRFLPVVLSLQKLAANHSSGSAIAHWPEFCLRPDFFHVSAHSWHTATLAAYIYPFFEFSSLLIHFHLARSRSPVRLNLSLVLFPVLLILLHAAVMVFRSGRLWERPTYWILRYFRYIPIGRVEVSYSKTLVLVNL